MLENNFFFKFTRLNLKDKNFINAIVMPDNRYFDDKVFFLTFEKSNLP